MPLIQVQEFGTNSARRLGNRRAWAVKRAIDFGGAALGLLLLLPLILVVAAAVRLGSPGPILFRQPRMGRGGRVFSVLKFRSMTPDAETRLDELEALNESPGGLLFKIRDDPRVTPLGRFLRRTSMDELPQLINVLRGEMSLVGPRPLQLRDWRRLLGDHTDLLLVRVSAPPGLTGLAQISGRRDITPRDLLELDRSYVENWSLGGDLKILLRTIDVVLSGRGAF